MNKKDINTLILVGLLIILVWLLFCIFEKDDTEGYTNDQLKLIKITGEIKDNKGRKNVKDGDTINIIASFDEDNKSIPVPNEVTISIFSDKDKKMVEVSGSEKRKWSYSYAVTEQDIKDKNEPIKVKLSVKGKDGTKDFEHKDKDMTVSGIVMGKEKKDSGSGSGDSGDSGSGDNSSGSGSGSGSGSDSGDSGSGKIQMAIIDGEGKDAGGNTGLIANIGDYIRLSVPFSMLTKKEDGKNIKAKLLFNKTRETADITPSESDKKKRWDFLYKITSDDPLGDIHYSVIIGGLLGTQHKGDTDFKLEAKKADEKLTKLDDYPSFLDQFTKLAKTDDIFNESVKKVWPKYKPVKNIYEPVQCTNPGENNCTYENEINWNVVLAVSCLVVTDTVRRDASAETFDNLIEGFNENNRIYLLDVNFLIGKLNDVYKENILENLKVMLRWKKVFIKGGSTIPGEISYINGEWSEKHGGDPTPLKDMTDQGYEILGKISARSGKTIPVLDVLSVLTKKNPSENLAELQLATHLFVEQPIYIRSNKYTMKYTKQQQDSIKKGMDTLVKVGALPENDCYKGVGSKYNGKVNTYVSPIDGTIRNCAKWNSDRIPFSDDPSKIQGGVIKAWNKKVGRADSKYRKGGMYAHLVKDNFCRNPDPVGRTGEGPWCYTEEPGVRWAQCSINKCSGNQEPKHKEQSSKIIKKDCNIEANNEVIKMKQKLKIINTILRKENKVLDDKIVRLYKTLEGTRN